MHTMGQHRWQAAYRLLKVAGLIDPVNGHLRTHSHEWALLALRAEVEAQRQRLATALTPCPSDPLPYCWRCHSRRGLPGWLVDVHRPSLHDAQLALDALQAQLVPPQEVHNQARAEELAEAAGELQSAIEALFDEQVRDVTVDAG